MNINEHILRKYVSSNVTLKIDQDIYEILVLNHNASFFNCIMLDAL